jgi:hypothetical protein
VVGTGQAGSGGARWDLDGAHIFSPGQSITGDTQIGFQQTSKATLDLTAGLHSIAARVVNAAPTGANPTGFAFTVVTQFPDGTLGAIEGSSSVAGGALVIEYPAVEPGMTPGEAFLFALNEARTGTALGGGRATGDPLAAVNLVSTTFDETFDTDGVPWPSTAMIATKVGTTLLTFLRELAAAGHLDFAMTPGALILNAWVGGTRGDPSGVDFHSPTDENDPTTGNLAEHHEKSEG